MKKDRTKLTQEQKEFVSEFFGCKTDCYLKLSRRNGEYVCIFNHDDEQVSRLLEFYKKYQDEPMKAESGGVNVGCTKVFKEYLKSFKTDSEKKKFVKTFMNKYDAVLCGAFRMEDFSWSKNEIERCPHQIVPYFVDWYLRDKEIVKPLAKHLMELAFPIGPERGHEDPFKILKTKKEHMEFMRAFGICNFVQDDYMKYFSIEEIVKSFPDKNPPYGCSNGFGEDLTDVMVKLYLNDKEKFLELTKAKYFHYESDVVSEYFEDLETFEEKQEFAKHFNLRCFPISMLLHFDGNGKASFPFCEPCSVCKCSTSCKEKNMQEKVLFAANLPSFRRHRAHELHYSVCRTSDNELLNLIKSDKDKKAYLLKFKNIRVSTKTLLMYIPYDELDNFSGSSYFEDWQLTMRYFARYPDLHKKKFWKKCEGGRPCDFGRIEDIKNADARLAFMKIIGVDKFDLESLVKEFGYKDLLSLSDLDHLWIGEKYGKLGTRTLIDLYERNKNGFAKRLKGREIVFDKKVVLKHAESISDEDEKLKFLFIFLKQETVYKHWKKFIDMTPAGAKITQDGDVFGLFFACKENTEEFKKYVGKKRYRFDYICEDVLNDWLYV